MKLYIHMKTPDALDDAVIEYAEDKLKSKDPNMIAAICDEEDFAFAIEDAKDEVKKILSKWFKYNEYATIEVDTDTKTAIVKEVKGY